MLTPKYTVGQRVLYTNQQGVEIGIKTIVGIDKTDFPARTGQPRYFIEPTDTPWYSVAEKCLAPAPPEPPAPKNDTKGAW